VLVSEARGACFRWESLSIDPVAREVRLGESKIDLSAKEVALLRDVWGFKLMGTSRPAPVRCGHELHAVRAERGGLPGSRTNLTLLMGVELDAALEFRKARATEAGDSGMSSNAGALRSAS
jgi:hypothetical protein